MKFEDLHTGQDVTSLCTRCGVVHDWYVDRKVSLGERVILFCATGKQACGLNAQMVNLTSKHAPKPKGVEE